MSRRGLTLIELLVAMVLMAIIGTALVRLLISDSRFVARQEAMLSARQAARAAMNVMTAELRLVPDSGLRAASRDSIVVRIPYVFGVSCRISADGGGGLIMSYMPVDSLTFATARPAGIGWRQASGVYTSASLSGIVKTTEKSACDQDSIRVIPGGDLLKISGIPAAQRPAPGRVMFVYQTVRYKFAPSADLPGRRALWRLVASATDEELVAPFDTAARFAFLVGPNLTLDLTPPADLSTVRGLELRLLAESETIPGGRTRPESFPLVTQVPFLNRLN